MGSAPPTQVPDAAPVPPSPASSAGPRLGPWLVLTPFLVALGMLLLLRSRLEGPSPSMAAVASLGPYASSGVFGITGAGFEGVLGEPVVVSATFTSPDRGPAWAYLLVLPAGRGDPPEVVENEARVTEGAFSRAVIEYMGATVTARHDVSLDRAGRRVTGDRLEICGRAFDPAKGRIFLVTPRGAAGPTCVQVDAPLPRVPAGDSALSLGRVSQDLLRTLEERVPAARPFLRAR